MGDASIDSLRRRLEEAETASAARIDSAFTSLEEKIVMLLDTIESAHEVRLAELRQEADRLAAGRPGRDH